MVAAPKGTRSGRGQAAVYPAGGGYTAARSEVPGGAAAYPRNVRRRTRAIPNPNRATAANQTGQPLRGAGAPVSGRVSGSRGVAVAVAVAVTAATTGVLVGPGSDGPVDGTGVLVGGIGVSVGGTGVLVGGMGVSVGGMGVGGSAVGVNAARAVARTGLLWASRKNPPTSKARRMRV